MSFESREAAIRVTGAGKCYRVYSSPSSRLKEALAARTRGLFGLEQHAGSNEFWALRDVSFEVPKGEAFGVIGRNGSGKSTLLQMITGVLNPTEGSIETVGRIAALLELGSGFNPEFTGRENVYLNGMLLGLSRAEIDHRFDGIAAFADIGEHLDRPIKTYSSGMLVRLAFAVQVQIEPEILIIDEALAVGDALFQKRCFSRINRLVDDGVTILFVSHDQEMVRTLTRRAILLHDGRMMSLGSSSQTLLAYRRLINQEESKYFASLSSKGLVLPGVAPSASEPPPGDDSSTGGEPTPVPADTGPSPMGADTSAAEPETAQPAVLAREPGAEDADKTSFGVGYAHVEHVTTHDETGEVCSVFYPGDRIRIRVACRSEEALDRLNVSLRIRSREGIKVYSWGTLNQDMQVHAGRATGSAFWNRRVEKGEEFAVWFECDCSLGPGFYEIQAAISHEAEPDYSRQTILHWRDEAAFFQVFMDPKAYFFGGNFDLRMSARW